MIGGSFRDRWFGWFALDPNPRFKLAHLLAGAAVALGVRLYPGCNHDWLNVIIIVALIGAAYELLETWDAGHGAYGANTLGNAGYGFSWRDVVTDGAGAIALGLAAGLVRLLTGLVLLGVLALPFTLPAAAQTAHYRHDGRWALPDSVATPGAIDTSDSGVVCHRTTKTLRHVTAAMHHAIFATYGIPWAQHAKFEDDHLISLELGGRNDNANRWPQPYPQAYAKDSVENWSHRQACRGRLSLPFVQRQIVADWVVLYRQMHAGP